MERSSFARRQVKVSSELLSRLSIRCSAEQREELINLARQMYELPLFRERYWLHDCPKVLFRRLLSYGLSREQVLRWLPELLGLPVPGEAGFNVVRPETWADPIDFVLWDYGEPLGEGLDRSSNSLGRGEASIRFASVGRARRCIRRHRRANRR